MRLQQKQLGSIASIGNLVTGGSVGTAVATVDGARMIMIAQTTSGQSITLPNPTDSATPIRIVVCNTGTVAFTFYGSSLLNGLSTLCVWNGSTWTVLAGAAQQVYSTTETATGMLWSPSGKQIYRKVISFTNVLNGTVADATLTSSYVTCLIRMSGDYVETTTTYPFPYNNVASLSGGVSAHLTASGIVMEVGGLRSATNSGFIVVEYTK